MADDMRRPGESKADFQARMRAAFDNTVAKGKVETEARDVSSLVRANTKAPAEETKMASLSVAAPAKKESVVRERQKELDRASGYADGGCVRSFPKTAR